MHVKNTHNFRELSKMNMCMVTHGKLVKKMFKENNAFVKEDIYIKLHVS